MNEREVLLKAEHVFFRYNRKGKWVLQDVSLSVLRGEWLVIVGPNGAGKSTLLRVLAGIAPPEQGRVFWRHQDLYRLPTRIRAQHLGYLEQKPSVALPYTVEEVVAWSRLPYYSVWKLKAERKCWQPEQIQRWIERLNLKPYRSMPVYRLSGGEQQRVFLAMLLAQNTPVLLLDEPIQHLDPCHQVQILRILHALKQEGKTLITILHDLNIAVRVGDRLLFLKEGCVQGWVNPANKAGLQALIKKTWGDCLTIGSEGFSLRLFTGEKHAE